MENGEHVVEKTGEMMLKPVAFLARFSSLYLHMHF